MTYLALSRGPAQKNPRQSAFICGWPLGFTECGFDVGNADVKDHIPFVVDASANPTRDACPIAGGVAVYEPVIPRLRDRFRNRSARVEFPSKQVAIVTPKLLRILPNDLKVHNWLSNGEYLLSLVGLVVRLLQQIRRTS
jgi:hypothetical protein